MGFADLEPIVSDMIQKANMVSNRANNQMLELKKEVTEFKAHIESITNNSDMPMLKPVK